jgi:hypothetical protein
MHPTLKISSHPQQQTAIVLQNGYYGRIGKFQMIEISKQGVEVKGSRTSSRAEIIWRWWGLSLAVVS